MLGSALLADDDLAAGSRVKGVIDVALNKPGTQQLQIVTRVWD